MARFAELRDFILRAIATVLLSSLLAVYAFEFGVTLILNMSGHDTRTRFEVADDLAAEGFRARPAIYPQMLFPYDGYTDTDVKPLAGISNVLTVLCREGAEFSKYTSDRYGFNNPNYIWDSSPSVALIGDSFTHGACVADDQTISARMNEFKGSSEALNLGIGGASLLTERAILREYLPKSITHIVWLYAETNDLAELSLEAQVPALTAYDQPVFSQQLRARQQEIDERLERFISDDPITWLKQRTKHLRLYNIRTLVNRVFSVQQDERALQTDLYIHYFKQISARATAGGHRLTFVYLPSLTRYQSPKTQVEQDNFLEKGTLLREIRNLGVRVIDMDAEFRRFVDDPISLYPQERHMHFTPEGYALIASTIASNLD